MNKLEEPLNIEERYLHGINIRLNILIEMFSSFLDVYAVEEKVATSENTEVVKVKVEEEVEGQITLDSPTNTKTYYSYLTKKDITRILDEYDIEYANTMLKSELIDLVKNNI